MRVSVIVPCRNEAGHIRALLDSLLAQRTDGLDVEFLIADGMSDDGTRAVVTEYTRTNPTIRMIDNPGRIVSTGLNAAIRQSTGEIIVRMDAHTEFDPTYIAQCVETLNATGADNVGGPARTKAEGIVATAIATAYHSPFSTGGAKFHDPDYEGPVDTVTYGCWRRETFERIGFFDEFLVRNQDDEFNLRLVRSGGKIWQTPSIISWYKPRGDVRSLFKQYFQYGFWKVAVIRKHKIPASFRHLIPGLFVLTLAALAAASFVSRACLALFLVLAGLYLLATCIFSVRALKAPRNARVLLVLPIVFPTYHFSYGLGFLAGLLNSHKPGAAQTANDSAFAGLSR